MFPLCAAIGRISNAAIAFLLVGAALLVLAAGVMGVVIHQLRGDRT